MNIQRLFNMLRDPGSEKLYIFLDQALFAFFNFGSIFVLSKLASIPVFSSFVLFQSNIFFQFIFCTFFLSSPVLVLYSKKWKENPSYLKVLFWTNFGINIVLSAGIFIFLRNQGISTQYWLVFSIPMLMSLFDLFKKYIFSSLKIKLYHAVISSLLLNSIFFIGIVGFRDGLSLSAILGFYMFAFLVASIYLLIIFFIKRVVQVSFLFPFFSRNDAFMAILKHHYHYSKWIIMGGIAFWGYSQGIFIYSGFLGASDLEIGKIRTIQNLLGIVNIFIISVENFYTPVFAKNMIGKRDTEVHSFVKELYLKHFFKIVGVMLGVFIFAIVFYHLLYLEKYGDGLQIIILFTLLQLILFTLRPLIISLKSLEITYPFFWAHLWAVLVMLSVGYFFINRSGDFGMAMTYVLANVFFTVIVIYFYWYRVLRH